MTYEKLDGVIEIGFSGCCCPPGQVREGIMHTNSTTDWVRFGGGTWHRVHRQSWARLYADCSVSVRECIDQMIHDHIIDDFQ